jgi:hypothetical protein
MPNLPLGPHLYLTAETLRLTIGQLKRLDWTTVVECPCQTIRIVKKDGNIIKTRATTNSKAILDGILAAEAKDGMSRMYGMTLPTRRVVPRLRIAPGNLLPRGNLPGVVTLNTTAETINETTTQTATRKAGSEVHMRISRNVIGGMTMAI